MVWSATSIQPPMSLIAEKKEERKGWLDVVETSSHIYDPFHITSHGGVCIESSFI